MAFYNLKPCDIIATYYKTYPSYGVASPGGEEETVLSIVLSETLNEESKTVFRSSFYFLDTDGEFSPGTSRDLNNSNGSFVTGSWNLSGAIEAIPNLSLSSRDKNSILRLKSLYAENAFIKQENYLSESILSSGNDMLIINIPQVLYGSEIKPGSFRASLAGAINSDEYFDDGYGGLYEISGGAASEDLLVGSIFYQHGIIMFGENIAYHTPESLDSVSIDFSGTSTIPMTMYICTAPRGESNFSNNESFTLFSSASNKNEITTKDNETYITTVGLYDEDYNLLGVAKTSKPILNKEGTSIQFRLKLNY